MYLEEELIISKETFTFLKEEHFQKLLPKTENEGKAARSITNGLGGLPGQYEKLLHNVYVYYCVNLSMNISLMTGLRNLWILGGVVHFLINHLVVVGLLVQLVKAPLLVCLLTCYLSMYGIMFLL